MSPHPGPVDKSPIQPRIAGEDFVFGEDPQSLALPMHVVAEIWGKVHQGMRTLARGGLEVGGLLVGPKTSGRTVVDSIIPLPIEYRHGPSFQMSSSDLANIVPAIESVQGDGSKTVVGFYRSRTRGDGTLRESDHEIFNAIERALVLPAVTYVRLNSSSSTDFRWCFVVAPMSESAALVCVAMRNADGWEDMQPFTLRSDLFSSSTVPSSTGLLQMPRRQDLDKEEGPIGSPVSLSAAQPVTDHPELEQSAASLAVGRRDVWGARSWLYAAACVALAGGVAVPYRWAVRKQPQPTASVRTQTGVPRTHLGFSATPEGSVWKLAWDRAAMDALNPIAAVLFIQDGGYAQQVPLAPADLASGAIFYTPQNNNLAFRLRIDRGGEQIEEHVRVLGAPRMTPPPVDRVLQSVPAKAPIPARPDTRGVTIPSDLAPTAAAPVAVPALAAGPKPSSSIPMTVTLQKPTIASTTDREAKSNPAPAPPSTAVAIAIPVPPTVEPRANLAPPTAPAVKPTPDVTPVRAPVDQQAVRSPVAAGAASPSESARAAVTRAPNEVKEGPPGLPPLPPAATPNAPVTANYVGPKPIQQVRPQSSAKMPSGVSQVQVQVDIDPRGKVVKVTPIGLTVTNAPLMTLAEQAASFWIFEPARLNGHAVSSQMNLTFQF